MAENTDILIEKIAVKHQKATEELSERNERLRYAILDDKEIKDGFRLLHACVRSGVPLLGYHDDPKKYMHDMLDNRVMMYDVHETRFQSNVGRYLSRCESPRYGRVLFDAEVDRGKKPSIGFQSEYGHIALAWNDGCHRSAKIFEETFGLMDERDRLQIMTHVDNSTEADPFNYEHDDFVSRKLDAEYRVMRKFIGEAHDFLDGFMTYVSLYANGADRREYDCEFDLMDSIVGPDRKVLERMRDNGQIPEDDKLKVAFND